MTKIGSSTMKVLRDDIDKALTAALAKHGLKANIGRITYEPGKEFRVKLTVVQPMTGVSTSTPAQIGEKWNYMGKTYTVFGLKGVDVQLERHLRNGRLGRFRVSQSALQAGGVKVSA